MHNIDKLKVFQTARENLRAISNLKCRIFGDLQNQMQRAAISVVSNIAEGAGSGTDKQFIRYLNIARGSNNEFCAHIKILMDITGDGTLYELEKSIQIVGKMLTKFIQRLGRQC